MSLKAVDQDIKHISIRTRATCTDEGNYMVKPPANLLKYWERQKDDYFLKMTVLDIKVTLHLMCV
jgi:hypothetical protein